MNYWLFVPTSGPIVPLPEPVPAEAYDVLSGTVGGVVEAVAIDAGLIMWVHEEGKLEGLDPNPRAQGLWDSSYGPYTDRIVGPVVLTGGTDDRGETLGLDWPTALGLAELLGS